MKFDKKTHHLIAQFKGIPAENALMANNKRTFSIATLLDNCLKQNKIGQKRIESVILENWETIIGPTYTQYCYPFKIYKNKTLVIKTTHATVKCELAFKKLTLIKSINQLLNKIAIEKIVFI